MSKLPPISVISPTYNCDIPLFKKSLESIKMQIYPKSLIEHIVIDGGSTNNTVSLAKSFGCKIISRPDLLFESQTRMSIGIKKASNSLILIFESDNIMVGRDWLQKMTLPLIEDKNISCTFSMHNAYTKDMPLLTKYCALFGVNDAYLYYLKSEKMPLDKHIYNKGTIIKETPSYYIVKFDHNLLPPMGDNGFMIRSNVIAKVNKRSEDFIHVDAFAEMVKMGFDTFGVVKNSIVHYTGSNIIEMYKRRVAIKSRFYDDRRTQRKYLVFNPYSSKDIWNTLKFVVFSLTIIFPLLRSVSGYVKIREVAWFLHPIVCFVAVIFYAQSEMYYSLRGCVKNLPKLSEIIVYEKRS